MISGEAKQPLHDTTQLPHESKPPTSGPKQSLNESKQKFLDFVVITIIPVVLSAIAVGIMAAYLLFFINNRIYAIS